MISLTKIIDPLSGYIAKVQKDVSDRQRERQDSTPKLSGAAKLLSAEEAVQAAFVNRLSAEISEIRSGLKNMRDGLEALDIAESAYDDVLTVLDKMQSKISEAQNAEDLNTAVSSDYTNLSSALTSFSTEINNIISSRQMNEQNLIDGTFSNKIFPLWASQTDHPTISLQNITETMSSYKTFSAVALTGDLNSNIDGTSIAASKTISISAQGETKTFDQLSGESSSSLAARINLLAQDKETDIGILASARNTVRLNDLSNPGTLTLSISSERLGMASQNIGSVVISDKADLQPLALAVNRYTDATGIYATMGGANNDVILTDPNGGNIGISSFTHSVNNSNLSVSVDRRDGITDFSLDGETVTYNDVDAGFAGGSITFGMVGNLTSENVNLPTLNAGSTSIGSVSIDANKNIFLGTGSGQTQIGSVDSSNNGVGGNSLQINFSSNSRVFANGTFDTDSNWTKVSSQIISGTTTIDGLTTLRDTTFPSENRLGSYGTLTINSGTASGSLTINSGSASGSLTVNSGDSDDTLSAITIDGTNLISGTITYVDNNTTAAAIRTAINNRTGSTGYSAGGSGSQVTISTSTIPSSTDINLTTSGTFNMSTSNLTASALSAITIDGTNLIADTVTYSNNSTTAADIRTAINNRTGTTGYSAGGSGSQVTITTSTVPSDTSISLTTSGGLNTSSSDLSASTLSGVTIDGTNLISGTVTYSDNNTTAENIRTAINNRTGTTGYTATGSGAEVVINSPTTPSNTVINLTKSSSLSTSVSNLNNIVDTDKTTMTTGSLSTTIDDGNDNLGKMVATNVGSKLGYNLTKGMALQSANSVRLYANEQVSFRWRMDQTSGGKGDFQAYLVNTANNAYEEIINTTANNSSGWQTETHTISTSGDYKIAFIGGAYDDDGDGLSNVRIRVDNVEVAAISDDVLDIIKNNVTYENLNFSASNSSYTPQVSVTSVTGGGASTTETVDVPATLAGFSLTGGADQEVFATGEVTLLSQDSFSLSQQDSNTNGTTFWETANPAVTNLELLSGSSPLGTESSLTLDNASERITIAIGAVSQIKEKHLPALRSQFDFGEFDSSNYLNSLNISKVGAMKNSEAETLAQRSAKIIIADEVQKLLAKAGNASADDVYELIRAM